MLFPTAVRKNRYVILPVDFEEAWKVSCLCLVWPQLKNLTLFPLKQTVKRSDDTHEFCESSHYTSASNDTDALSLIQTGSTSHRKHSLYSFWMHDTDLTLQVPLYSTNAIPFFTCFYFSMVTAKTSSVTLVSLCFLHRGMLILTSDINGDHLMAFLCYFCPTCLPSWASLRLREQ